MSALGDRIVAGGPYVANVDNVPFELSVVEWNALRQELIDLRARAAPPMGACVIEGHGGHPAWECKRRDPVAGGLRPCPICEHALIGPDLVECTLCAASEDAAAKRRADQ